jgi:hypothetical protein
MPLLGIYPKECKTAHNRDSYTSMFIVVQLTIAKLWDQPRCPSTNKWVKKMWYIYTLESFMVLAF